MEFTAEEKEILRAELTEKIHTILPQIGAQFPTMADGGSYSFESGSFWTKGFWPGMLWNLYQLTGEDALKQTAVAIEEKLDELLHDFYDIHHDAGFVWSLTAVADYKLTGNPESRRRALIAASHLAGRFNIKGNFIRAWNPKQGKDNEGWAIVDCSMNLPLLYWASQETGDPRFKHIAMAHADTVLREFIRGDGSTHHIVCFDPETGVCVEKKAGQGLSPDSAWARGQSWILYGMALSYRYTGQARYLRAATDAAEYFFRNLPEDQIPYWDFDADPAENPPRDTSAAACAACGMLELGSHPEIKDAEKYRSWGEQLVKALRAHWWQAEPEKQGLLGGGTFNFPKGKGIHVSLIYGDYFYTEAVTRILSDPVIFW